MHETAACAQIFVFFPEDDKVGVKSIKTYRGAHAQRGRVPRDNGHAGQHDALRAPVPGRRWQPKYYIEVVSPPLLSSLQTPLSKEV